MENRTFVLFFMIITWHFKDIHQLEKVELYEILKIRAIVFVVEQNCVYLDLDDKDNDALHFLGKNEENEIVAYCRIFTPTIKESDAAIGRVLVMQEYRGTGLGKLLMQKAIDYLENNLTVHSIKIEAQHYLLAFYQSLGFKKTSEVYLLDEIPHIEMVR